MSQNIRNGAKAPRKSWMAEATVPPGRVTRRISSATRSASGITSSAKVVIGVAFDPQSAPKADPTPTCHKRSNSFQILAPHEGQCWTPKGVNIRSRNTRIDGEARRNLAEIRKSHREYGW